DGIPMDLGCEWLHSADRNVLAPLAKQLGFAINERRPDWTTRLRYSGESLEAEADWIAEREAFYWAVHRLAQLPEDSPCSAALTPGGRWNALLDATSTWGNAVELDQISAKDNDRYEAASIGASRAAMAGCSRRSPTGFRSRTARRRRASIIA